MITFSLKAELRGKGLQTYICKMLNSLKTKLWNGLGMSNITKGQ